MKEQLLQELEHLKRMARRNYGWLYALSVAAVLASFFASLSVASSWFARDVQAILAAIPAVVIVIADRFKLEEKANWYWGKYYALDQIASGLAYEGLSEADASKRRGTLNVEWEMRWPGFGAPPK